MIAAQAFYSLTQDNRDFVTTFSRQAGVISELVNVCVEDHQTAEQAATRKSPKGKSKETQVSEDGEIPDGRALLCRLLFCGNSFPLLPLKYPTN